MVPVVVIVVVHARTQRWPLAADSNQVVATEGNRNNQDVDETVHQQVLGRVSDEAMTPYVTQCAMTRLMATLAAVMCAPLRLATRDVSHHGQRAISVISPQARQSDVRAAAQCCS
jgi:hypothetical protein